MGVTPSSGAEIVRLCYRSTSALDALAIEAAFAALSQDERARHDRFMFARDRRDYAVAHALLRNTLSALDGRSPNAWRFEVAPGGKPVLPVGDPSGLAFNLSHSDGIVACAIGVGVSIGVDVETIRYDRSFLEIAERHFAHAEYVELQKLPSPVQAIRFTELWVLKEAFAKATGLGIHRGLSHPAFCISVEGVMSMSTLPADQASGWHLELFAPSDAQRMAIALCSTGDAPRRVVVASSGSACDPVLTPIRSFWSPQASCA